MDIVTLLLIAVGLSMDAFAVAIGIGVMFREPTFRQIFRLSFHFGLFQALMPVIGWAAGLSVEKLIETYDHWIAFALLAIIGGKMIYESFHEDEKELSCDPTKGMSLLLLSIATSIDALAVGFSLALLRVSIWFPSCVIGIVTLLITVTGMLLGKRLGALFGRRVSILGGVILLLIGIRILIEHMWK